MRNFLTVRNASPFFTDFDGMLDRFFTEGATAAPKFSPSVDIEETPTGYQFMVDVPGMAKEDFKIEMNENRLEISGERKTEKTTEEQGNRKLTERYFGSFYRAFTLPATVDAAQIDASYRDGVLRINLPKSENAKPRQIKIA